MNCHKTNRSETGYCNTKVFGKAFDLAYFKKKVESINRQTVASSILGRMVLLVADWTILLGGMFTVA